MSQWLLSGIGGDRPAFERPARSVLTYLYAQIPGEQELRLTGNSQVVGRAPLQAE